MAPHRLAARRTPPASAVFARQPLAAAVAAAFATGLGLTPASLLAQAARPTQPRPAAATVPVPAASWRVDGTGATAPVNRPNTAGGVDQTIGQTSQRAIYRWNSFDIGADSSVTFDMALPGSAALNRITGSTAPSQIFGRLSATQGGEIYLINPNGVLFGSGAQVRDVGALVASTLNLTDEEFRSGLVNAIRGGAPAFRYDGTPADWVDERNFVRVDPGAEIRTVDGGRILLFAKRVENAGTLSAPSGQVVLGAGSEVYLNLPTNESALYGADASGTVPALRGLLVEMGSGLAGASVDNPQGEALAGGFVNNLASGVINTPRGNTTLVGLAVNHSGRISATTSVSENGSVFLRAQGGPVRVNTENGANTKRATQAGALTLGDGAVIEITPDTRNEDAGQAPATSDNNSSFVASRIDLTGLSVDIGAGAQIVAPGGTLNVLAEATPRYELVPSAATPYTGGVDGARIVLGEGALLDVSGTTDTVLSVDRHFVTTELLGSNDLRDAPLQKDGLLFRSRVTLDTRGSSPILGDLEGYRDGLQRTASERLAAGGTVNLVAQGGVVMAATAAIDVSGGQVAYTAATVAPTRLQGADGALYDLNNAPVDGLYTRGYNLRRPADAAYDRWGVAVNYGAVLPGRDEAGYVDGQNAGALRIVAPVAVLSSHLSGGTVAGDRQIQGLDARAVGGRLEIGAAVNGGAFGDASYQGAVLGTAVVTATPPPVDTVLRADPMGAALPETTWVPLQALIGDAGNARGGLGGFANVAVATEEGTRLQADAPVEWLGLDSLQLLSRNGQVRLAADLRAPSAQVTLNSLGRAATVVAGSEVDLSGVWLNQRLDGPLATDRLQGGSLTVSGARAELGTGVVVDVSGGATVTAAGSLVGGNAGAIAVAGRTAVEVAGETLPAVLLGAELRGHSLATGGTLSITAPDVLIGTAPPASPADPAVPAPLATLTPLPLAADTFTQGGFSTYNVTGVQTLEVAAGTQIAPRRDTFLPATLGTRDVPSGADTAAVLGVGVDPLTLPRTVDLNLASPGAVISGVQIGGALRVGAGAVIDAVAQSKVALSAGRTLQFDGAIHAPGGAVSLRTTPGGEAFDVPSWLWLGDASRIDVAGTTLATVDAAGLRTGRVLDGGSVTLAVDGAVGAGSLVMRRGAEIDVRGTRGTLDIARSDGGALRTERQTIDSNGGSLTVRANRDLYLDGTLRAQAGGDGLAPLNNGEGTAAGGSLSVTLAATRADAPSQETPEGTITPPPDYRILRIVEGRTGGAATLTTDTLADPLNLSGRASVSAAFVRDAGVVDFSATARDRIVFTEDVNLAVDRTLTLSARLLATRNDADVSLQAAQAVIGSTAFSQYTTEENLVNRALPMATTGGGSLAVQADNLIVQGRLVTQGMDSVTLRAEGDLLLRSDNQDLGFNIADKTAVGSLSVQGDLTLQAAQIYPATNTRFTVDSGRGALTIESSAVEGSGAPLPDAPLSAGGSLTLRGQTITQGGVVRAPHGRIELDGRDGVTLAAGSVTSVSGAGTVVPYGVFTDDDTWRAPSTGTGNTTAGAPITQAPGKAVVLGSRDGVVDVQAGATLDLSGGGSLQATQFVPGPGGSTDVFTGADGSYAILPGFDGLAPHDPLLAEAAARIGRQIDIGPGAPVPPGRYTLLPARYALLAGGVLVRPQTGGTRLDRGAAVAQNDGSVLIGARGADLGTPYADALDSTWRLTTREVALRSSEIRVADAGTFFPALAERRDLPASRVPNDAGALTIAANAANLDGRGLFDAAPGGLGGELQFSAERIRVVDAGVAGAEGELTLRADQLNAFGAQTLILGATRREGADALDADGATRLDVRADSVVLAQQADALAVPDLIAAARSAVRVEAGATVRAAGGAGSGSAEADGLTDYRIEGDGAALRVAAQTGAGIARSATRRETGELTLGAGAQLNAAGGSIVLDATARNTLEVGSSFNAADITLTAARIAVGPAATADAQTLALGNRLLNQLGRADALTLRSYSSIDFGLNASLGSASLDSLTLDAPRLRVNNADSSAQAVAGTVVLTNTVGADPLAGLLSGGGDLRLQATAAEGGSGQVVLADGRQNVRAGLLTLQADAGVVLDGTGTLNTSGRLTMETPTIVALTAGAEHTVTAGDLLRLAAAPRGPAAAPDSADGARLTLNAPRITQSTDIVLPSGSVSIHATGTGIATGTNAEVGLQLRPGATIDTAGRTRSLAGTPVDLAGGEIRLQAASGDIVLEADTRLDVSAAGTARGGSLSITATDGALVLDGTLAGSTSAAATGARLSLDSAQAVDLAALGAQLAPTADGRVAFGDSLFVRNREGDQQLAAGSTLAAREITLQADAGALRVAGTLDASGNAASARGGRIVLAAGGDVTLADGAVVDASALGGTLGVQADGLTPATTPDATITTHSGGTVALGSTGGTVAVQAGSTVDLRGSTPENGSALVIRAARTGGTGDPLGPGDDPTSAGTDVAVAPIEGSLNGVRRVDVEAVKVYDGITSVISREAFFGLPAESFELDTARIARESTAFLTGSDGLQATRVAERLAGGNAELLAALTLRPGVEIRSSGDLAINTFGTWSLPTDSLGSNGVLPNVGDTSVTLRAAGDLRVPYSINAGYATLFGFANFEAPVSASGGSLRLVAGADLSAAVASTTRNDRQGDLLVGTPPEFGSATTTVLATTTGDIELAAAGNVNIGEGRTRIVTMGRDSQDPLALAAEARLRATPELAGRLPSAQTVGYDADFNPITVTPSMFRVDGGDVRISAGGNVNGRQALVEFGFATLASVNDWRATGAAGGGETGASPLVGWWTKLRSLPVDFGPGAGFDYGVASFGGGGVDVRSGGDVSNLYAVTASSGFVDGTGPQATAQRYGAGDLRVQAGGDLVNGVYVGTGEALSLRAGGDIRRVEGGDLTAAGTGTRLVHENTRSEVTARGDITVHSARSAFASGRSWLSGLDGDAALAVQTTGGSLAYLGASEPVSFLDTPLPAEFLAPADLTMTAPNGALTLSGTLIQQPTDDGRLQLLARDDVTLAGAVRVQATRGSDLGPQFVVDSLETGVFAATQAVTDQAYADHGRRLDRSGRDPVRIASDRGDLVFLNNVSFDSARPVDLQAGRDLRWGGSALQVQHQSERWDAATGTWRPSAETSVMQAGRDLGTSTAGSLTVAGRGEVLLLAGRQIELGVGPGVRSVGNSVNLNFAASSSVVNPLPTGGASLTLVAGLRADGVDYARAVTQGFHALGGLGLGDKAGDVYAQLLSPGALVALDSAEAKAFNALNTAQQLAQVRSLLGAAAYDRALAAYVRGLPGNGTLSDAQALKAFGALPANRQQPAAGVLLAGRFGEQPAGLRSAFVGQLAVAEDAAADASAGTAAEAERSPSRLDQLTAHLTALGVQTTSAADAVAAFEALPLAQQVPLLNRLLVQDLRESGRAAVTTGGVEADTAYGRGYRAIDLLFPVQAPGDGSAGGRPFGEIRSASSQVKTLQQGDITLLAPGGGVNAGGVAALQNKSANELGIVTVAGGDISAVVGQDFLVNQSRVFTLAEGDILMWASQGDIDAGRGAKTVVGAPAPVLRLDEQGRLFLDTSGSFTGSGIAVLGADSELDLYAPQGAIDAGEAGIRASGNAFFGAQVVRGADNLQIGGVAAGAPPAPPTVTSTGALNTGAQDSANRAAASAGDDEDARRKRRLRRQLLLEFLGFGPRA